MDLNTHVRVSVSHFSSLVSRLGSFSDPNANVWRIVNLERKLLGSLFNPRTANVWSIKSSGEFIVLGRQGELYLGLHARPP